MDELYQCFHEAEEWIARAQCPGESCLAWEWFYEIVATIDWLQ